MAEIDLGEVAEKEIANRDRRIQYLEKALDQANYKVLELSNTLKAIDKVKTAILEAADYLDPYRWDDD